MDCDTAQEILPGYLDGSLTGEQRSNAEAHLRECSRCAAGERALIEALSLLRSLPPEKAPPELLERVRRGIAAEQAEFPARGRSSGPARIRIPVEAAAAVILVVLLYGIHSRLPHAERRPASPPSRVESTSMKQGTVRDKATGHAPQAERVAAAERTAPGLERADRVDSAPGAGADGAARASAETPAEPAPGRLASAPARSGLPVVPATRVSSAAEPIAPQFPGESREAFNAPPWTFAASSSRIPRSLPQGREVTLEILPDDRHGLEERIARAAENLGGTLRRETGRPGPPAEAVAAREAAEEFVRLHIPPEREEEFLAELRRLGTIPARELPADDRLLGWEAAPAVVSYTVRIRVR
jgi:hypothetical protein